MVWSGGYCDCGDEEMKEIVASSSAARRQLVCRHRSSDKFFLLSLVRWRELHRLHISRQVNFRFGDGGDGRWFVAVVWW